MADEMIHACIDRMLPGDAIPAGASGRLALVKGKVWKPGQTVRVRFLDGESLVQQKVVDVAKAWMQYANIQLSFGDDAQAEIRISFKETGSWSYIGTDATRIAKGKPTMNYGWLTRTSADSEYERVVLHEFGHALGCVHEHQNPATNIPWDKEAVYQYYMGPPNNWTREQVDTNLFQTYGQNLTQFTAFDKESIMLYPIPNKFTIGDFEVGFNRALSATDKQFIGVIYPFKPKNANELTIDAPATKASIGEFGEVDTFTFTVTKTARYRIETSGRTDVAMTLSGPDDPDNEIAADDDSGRGLNARIIADLASGEYSVRIRHFSAKRKGDYEIGVFVQK